MVRSGNRLAGGGVTAPAAAIVIPQGAFVPVPPESVTLIVKINGPGVVGFPIMAPVAVLRVRPGVRAPEATEKV
jgi:hypothetical protein